MTRRPAPDQRPAGLTIAGSDAGGGAGIQADLKTMEAHGLFATSAITAVTAQNTQGVESTHVLPSGEVAAQIDAVRSDFMIEGVKTGMLATDPIIQTVTETLGGLEAPLVVDPVMVAASGDRLLQPEAEDAYEDLLAEATVVTPNADEASVLTGIEITGVDTAVIAGEALVAMGADAALVKGGHVTGEPVSDVLVTTGTDRTDQTADRGDGVHVFEHDRIDTEATHGSGCTLSSAIVARLAQGSGVETAVADSVDFMERALRHHLDVGHGPGSVHHLVALRERAARGETAEAVHGVLRAFVSRDVSRLVPEVGMNVAAATPYAEATDEVAAVEGRVTRTMDGVAPNKGIRFGASSHVARFLLAAREFEPEYRFAVNCRFDDRIEAALAGFDWPVAEYDRAEEPSAVKQTEGSTMQWGARQAFGSADVTPVAVIDRGEVGKERLVKLLARDAESLLDRTTSLLSALE